MKRRATRSDVAARAGVSKATVTFVLSDRRDIAIPEATRDRVRQAARDLGYQPNAIARALGSGKTGAIAMAFPNLFVPNYCRMLQVFEGLAATHGYRLIASTVGQVNKDTVVPDIQTVLNGLSDAVVLVDVHELIRPVLAEIMPFHKPIVAMGIYPVPYVDCVEVDMLPALRAALQQLLDANPRRLAFFGFGSAEEAEGVVRDATSGRGDHRVIEYLRIITAAGRPIEVIHGSHAGRHGKIERLREYVAENGCPDALFCYDDEHAISAHHCLRRLGLRLPEDVLIVGMDGNEECEYLEPPITTIAMPVQEMCTHTWEFLEKRLHGDEGERQIVRLDAELRLRESSVRSATTSAIIPDGG